MEYYDSLIISKLDFPEELMNYLVWHYTCRPAERPLTLSWRQAPFLIAKLCGNKLSSVHLTHATILIVKLAKLCGK